jgi:hypothetical protein
VRAEEALMVRALPILVALLILSPPARAPAPAGSQGGGPVAGAASSAETVALRKRYFGAANVSDTGAVRRDRVIMSWVGVTNFAMAIRGHVVLLDAWVPRGTHSGYVPSSPDELAKLAPEAIFIGHAHFDHAADSVPIAQASGATIVGSAEQCAELRGRAPAMPPRCVEALPAGAAPGTTADVKLLSGVGVKIVKHLHSGPKGPGDDGTGYHVPVTPLPSTTQVEHPPTPQDMAQLVEHAPDAEAGTVLYRFEVGDLAFVWNDSAGPLLDDAPKAFDALKALRPLDLHVGAIQGFNQISNGMRDARLYIEALGAPLFVPTHHDDWAVGITTKGENYRAPLDQELSRIPADRRPQVRFIADPTDYVRPEVLTFPVKLDPPRLTRRCTGGGRLRVRVTGDLLEVRSVAFRLGTKGKSRADTAAPFELVYPRGALRARNQGTRVEAVVTDVDGSRRTLRRSLPSCGVRR